MKVPESIRMKIESSLEQQIIQLIARDYSMVAGDKVRNMFAEDIIKTVRQIYKEPNLLEVGQLQWLGVHKDDRPAYGKTVARMMYVPVVLTPISKNDLQMMASVDGGRNLPTFGGRNFPTPLSTFRPHPRLSPALRPSSPAPGTGAKDQFQHHVQHVYPSGSARGSPPRASSPRPSPARPRGPSGRGRAEGAGWVRRGGEPAPRPRRRGSGRRGGGRPGEPPRAGPWILMVGPLALVPMGLVPVPRHPRRARRRGLPSGHVRRRLPDELDESQEESGCSVSNGEWTKGGRHDGHCEFVAVFKVDWKIQRPF